MKKISEMKSTKNKDDPKIENELKNEANLTMKTKYFFLFSVSFADAVITDAVGPLSRMLFRF